MLNRYYIVSTFCERLPTECNLLVLADRGDLTMKSLSRQDEIINKNFGQSGINLRRFRSAVTFFLCMRKIVEVVLTIFVNNELFFPSFL